jgi:benzoate-CoA ligase
VPVPINTLLKPADYNYLLNDPRARVAIVSEALVPMIKAIPRQGLKFLEAILVVGTESLPGGLNFSDALAESSSTLDAVPTSKDDAAFWLYS